MPKRHEIHFLYSQQTVKIKVNIAYLVNISNQILNIRGRFSSRQYDENKTPWNIVTRECGCHSTILLIIRSKRLLQLFRNIPDYMC